MLRFLVPVLFLSACAPAPAPTPEPLPTMGPKLVQLEPDSCGAEAFGEIIGQPRAVLETRTLPDSARIIAPTDIVTTDYQPKRLNIRLDAEDVISRISCG